MPETIGAEAPQVDAFGEPVVKPVEGEGAGEGAGKVEGGGGEEGKEKLTPTQQVAELSRQLGEYQQKEKSWGETDTSKTENIRNMAAKIDALTKQAGGGNKGGEGDAEALFKDIKTSKDLTDDEREEMTDTDIKNMDMIAALQAGMNNLASMFKKGAGEKAGGEVDTNNVVRETALTLANKDVTIANQIIESTKQFNLTGLTEEQIIERVGKAAILVPTYKAPKEQAGGAGGRPAGGGDNSDPFGIDKIVEDVHKKQENAGFDL